MYEIVRNSNVVKHLCLKSIYKIDLTGADDVPPPKPSRQPQNTTEQSQLSAAPVSTYIVAQSPEVLAQLLKDNQARGVCPSVYTTPASPFNTLAVQFQDEDQILTTAVVSDLPFFDPALSEPPSITTLDTTQSGGDSILSDTNLDSLDSSLDTPLMSSLSISDTVAQTQSPAANRKQQKVKEMQNMYAVSSKVIGSITGDLYSPVQKFSASSAVPPPPAAASVVSAAVAGNTCGEIYGPVTSFTQSSAIVGNLSQSASLGGNYGENLGNFGPSSLGSSVIIPNSSSQTQFAASSSHALSQSVNYGNFTASNNTSQVFSSGGGQSTSQNVSVQSAGGSSSGGGGGSSGVIYSRISSANVGSSVSSAECLYGPVLKFRAQNAQPQLAVAPTATELKPVGAAVGNYGQAGRSNLVAQNLQSQPIYPQNYPHQQIYSNIAQPGQQPMYLLQMQHVQNITRPNAVPQVASYAAIQHSNQQSQLTGANPIYTAHATSVSVVQAQKVHMPNYGHQAQPGISGQPATCQATGANQPASVGMMQVSSVPSHFIMSSSATQQNIHSIPSAYIVDQQQPSSLGSIDYTQVHVGNVMTSTHQQHVTQPQMAGGVAKAANVAQIATGVAKITTFMTPQKQDEQLTSSTDGTLSGSLISSAVSDSTVSSSSSMTEEAQQDQVWPCLLGMWQKHLLYIFATPRLVLVF